MTTLHRRASIALLVYTAVSLCALVYPLGQAYVSSRRQAGVYGSASTVVRAQALPDGPDTGVRPSADVRSMPATSGADDGHPLLAGELLSVDLYPWPTGDAHEGEVRWLTYVELHRDHARQAP